MSRSVLERAAHACTGLPDACKPRGATGARRGPSRRRSNRDDRGRLRGPSSSSFCKQRSWRAIRCPSITSAASLSRSLAWNSPSALMTLARRSPRPRPAGPSRAACPTGLDVLHLDDRDLESPRCGFARVDDPLQDRVDLLALREQLVEDVLAEHRAQSRLRDLGGRDHGVLDVDDRCPGTVHLEGCSRKTQSANS